MKNIIKTLIISSVAFVLVGCTKETNVINYRLNIENSFQEKIEFNLSENAYEIANETEDYAYTNMEYALLYEEQEPIYSVHDEIYKKEIKKFRNKVNVTLSYLYKENDFINSNYIRNCFENYKIISKDDYLEINLSGKFYCLENKKLNIFVKTNHEVVNTNGTLNKGEYQWTIDQSNYQNVNIEFKINRLYSDMAQVVYNESSSDQQSGLLKNIIIILFVIGAIYLVTKIAKRFK